MTRNYTIVIDFGRARLALLKARLRVGQLARAITPRPPARLPR